MRLASLAHAEERGKGKEAILMSLCMEHRSMQGLPVEAGTLLGSAKCPRVPTLSGVLGYSKRRSGQRPSWSSRQPFFTLDVLLAVRLIAHVLSGTVRTPATRL